jgi:hypothetical protein
MKSCFEYQDLGGSSSVQVGLGKLSFQSLANSDARSRCGIAGLVPSSVHKEARDLSCIMLSHNQNQSPRILDLEHNNMIPESGKAVRGR